MVRMHFTGSIQMAMSSILKLMNGSLTDAQDRSVSSPRWEGFDFFSEINALDIQRIERIEPTGENPGYWKVSRQVEYSFSGQMVAAVVLRGHWYDKNCRVKEAWSVQAVHYARQFKNNRALDWAAAHLPDTELTIGSDCG